MSENLLDLEMELRSVAPQLLYPPAPQIAQTTRARLTGPVRHRLTWLRTVAVVLALVVIVLAAFPGVRRAVASWLGLGGIRIVLVEAPVLPDAAPLPATLGRPVTLDEAREAVAFDPLLPTTAGLGTPQVFLSEVVPGGMVSLLYPARDGDGPGLLITEFAGATDRQLLTKDVGPGTTVTPVAVGAGGFWIEGDPHTVLFEDETGDIRADEPRLAGNTLIWVDGGVTFRLESGGDLEQALEIVESMR